MIPLIRLQGICLRRLAPAGALVALLGLATARADQPPASGSATSAPAPAAAVPTAPAAGSARTGAPGREAAHPAGCVSSGDGYLRARVAGAIDAKIDWPNSGTRCQGESKSKPPGVRLSFQRISGGKPDLLFVFGLTGIRAGQPAHATGANLTLFVQGTDRIFGTLGDSRCTVDSLTQRPLPSPGTYRIEARGFCTQPAHAVRGDGDVLVSTFEFAGPVSYEAGESAEVAVKR